MCIVHFFRPGYAWSIPLSQIVYSTYIVLLLQMMCDSGYVLGVKMVNGKVIGLQKALMARMGPERQVWEEKCNLGGAGQGGTGRGRGQ